MEKLKVGIIGLGTVAEAHLSAYQSIGNIEISALSDIKKDRVEKFGKQFHCAEFTDYKKMLEHEKLDIVCVLVPASLHREVVEEVARHKIHILCEKPIAISMDDALAMKHACESADIKFYYGASYRHMPSIIKAKALIDEGKLGKITYMSEHMIGGNGRDNYRELTPIHYPLGGPGGAGLGLMDHGIHIIDLFNWYVKSPIVSVVGCGNYSGETPNTEFLMINYQNGALGELIYNAFTFPSDLHSEGIYSYGATWDIHNMLHLGGKWDEHPINIRVHGEKGALRIFPYANQLYYFTEDKNVPILLDPKPSPAQFGLQLESFTKSILNDKKPECSFNEAISALRVALAAYTSNKEQKIVFF